MDRISAPVWTIGQPQTTAPPLVLRSHRLRAAGPLALYRPSMNLTNYQVQFLGMIDKKALSWVVRAADFDNYYVIKLWCSSPPPHHGWLDALRVIHGKPWTASYRRSDGSATGHAVPGELELEGDEFSLTIQGQMVDTWSEPRLPKSGVGFFTARGEESRIRWNRADASIRHAGRLCAYLAPYETPTTNGSFKHMSDARTQPRRR